MVSDDGREEGSNVVKELIWPLSRERISRRGELTSDEINEREKRGVSSCVSGTEVSPTGWADGEVSSGRIKPALQNKRNERTKQSVSDQ